MDDNPNIDVTNSNRMKARQRDESMEEFEMRQRGNYADDEDNFYDRNLGKQETVFADPIEEEEQSKVSPPQNLDEAVGGFNIERLKGKPTNLQDNINDKKKFIKEFGRADINKGDGPYAKILYDSLTIVLGNKTGKVVGVDYNKKRITKIVGGKFVYSDNKESKKMITVYKKVLNKAKREHFRTPADIVETHLDYNVSEEVVDNIRLKATNDIGVQADLMTSELKDVGVQANLEDDGMYEYIENMTRQPENNNVDDVNLTEDEAREISGLAYKDWSKILREADNQDIRDHIVVLEIEKTHWNKLALDAKNIGDVKRHLLFESVAKLAELRADEFKMRLNERPTSELGIQILKNEAEVNDLAKLDRFKKWAKENLLGLSAITITIAGLVTTIIMGTRTIVKGGASALGAFGKAIANIAKKFGPVIAAIGSVVGAVLGFMGRGLSFLAQNLWLLVLAVAYFVYNEYVKKRGVKHVNK